MNDSKTKRPHRVSIAGWATIGTSDNGVEILEYRVRVDNFAQAVNVANKIAPLVMRYEPLDSEYTLRVNLSRWVVEARLSVPDNFWESEAQKELAHNIAMIAGS